MQPTLLFLKYSLVIAASLGVALGQTADQGVHADVRRIAARPFPVDDPDVAEFSLKLDVRLTNRSQRPVYIPKPELAKGPENRAALITFEARQSDGKWISLSQGSVYGTSANNHERCILLPPGGSAEFAGLSVGLVYLKSMLAGLGNELTVRLGLWFFCSQADGQVPITGVTTGDFKLRLPN